MQVTFTDDLVAGVQAMEAFPLSQQTFSDTDLVNFLNYELDNIISYTKACREKAFIHYSPTDIDVGPSYPPTAGQIGYEIPGQAIGLSVHDFFLVNPSQNNMLVRINIIDDEYIPYTPSINWWQLLPGQPYNAYIQNNQLIFIPDLTQNWKLRIRYFKRPNILTLQANAGQIISKSGSDTIVLSSIDPTWTTASSLDAFVPYLPYQLRAEAFTPLSVVGSTLTVDADTFALLQVGDWISTSDTAPFVQYLPRDCYRLLMQGAAMYALKALGDESGIALATPFYNQLKANYVATISPKDDTQKRKAAASNSIMDASRLRYWRY